MATKMKVEDKSEEMATMERVTASVEQNPVGVSEKVLSTLFDTAEGTLGMERVNFPQLMRVQDWPIGAVIKGKVLTVLTNYLEMEDMEDTKVLWVKVASGDEVLIPLTGVLGQAELNVKGGLAGKMIAIKRLPDGHSKKYNKSMFMFDLFVHPEHIKQSKQSLLTGGTPSV